MEGWCFWAWWRVWGEVGDGEWVGERDLLARFRPRELLPFGFVGVGMGWRVLGTGVGL